MLLAVSRWVVALALWSAMAAPAASDVQRRNDQAAGTDAQVERGRRVYAACVGCHGASGEGKVGVGPRLNDARYLSIVSNELLRRAIAEGRTDAMMIEWGAAIPADDIDALVAYIRSWQREDGVALDESPLMGDASRGAELYRGNCAECHGRSGAGYADSAPATGIGRAAYLRQVTNGELRALIRHGRDDAPARPTVANLSDAEADAIIRYLREEAW